MRVVVVGLRATGAAVAAWLLGRGDTVTVVEERPGQPGYDDRVAAVVAAGGEVLTDAQDWPALLADADLLVPSPGVRPDHPAMRAARTLGVPVRGDLDLAVEQATVPIAVVTGTNGKSSVTTLIAAMLDASGIPAQAVGNIGRVALDALADAASVLVVEASSFQLHTATAAFRPAVAVLLNLADDHLDWHGSFAAYAADKANAFRYQQSDATLVANLDDPAVMETIATAPGRLVGFSLVERPGAWSWRDATLLRPDGTAVLTLPVAATGKHVAAPHDRANLAAAAAAAAALGATVEGIAAAHEGFVRLHHRTEPVGKAGGVLYVDDSKATNPHAALAAVRGYEHVVLLAGGDSKGVDLRALAEIAPRLRAVVAIGDTPEEIEAVFAGRVPTVRAGSMHDAVRRAAELAEPGDVVLLAPACASFDWYDSYAARGDDFQREVAVLIEGAA